MIRPRPKLLALLVAACVASACTVALQPAGGPARAPQPTPTPTAVTATAVPTPLPTVAHLEKLAYDDAEPGPGDAAATVPVRIASAPPVAGTVTLERRGELLVGRGRIDGREIGDLLLDTSASAVFIDRPVADQVQLPEPSTASTADARDDREPSLREIHGLTIGDLPLAADRTFVVDLGAPDAALGGQLAGVVGLAALGTAPFTLDARAGTLTIHDDATFEPPPSIQAEALRIDQGLPFVEASLTDDTTVWFLLDTGSPAAISVWRGFAKQHPGTIRPAAAATGGEVGGGQSELRAVILLGERYDRIPIVIDDGAPRAWQRARVVGRVGMGLLRDLRLTIHPATERIWVERVGD
jgi:hypothetical protein